jgi:hypothetical protein
MSVEFSDPALEALHRQIERDLTARPVDLDLLLRVIGFVKRTPVQGSNAVYQRGREQFIVSLKHVYLGDHTVRRFLDFLEESD